jgi:hypothetical protein
MDRLACVAVTVRGAREAAGAVASRAPGASVEPYSLAGYVASETPPYRVVLCPPHGSPAEGREFLRRAAERLLWPAPEPMLAEAIVGLRGPVPTPPGRRPRPSPGKGRALLLEGIVDAKRARAALRAGGPSDWIVEGPSKVRMSGRELGALSRAGVRWAALEPVLLVALYIPPGLARFRGTWRHLVPARTPVWISDPAKV